MDIRAAGLCHHLRTPVLRHLFRDQRTREPGREGGEAEEGTGSERESDAPVGAGGGDGEDGERGGGQV